MNRLVVAIFLSLLFALDASAHSMSITIATPDPCEGYPAGTLKISGTITLDSGWQVAASTSPVASLWQDDSDVEAGPTLSFKSSGQSYEIGKYDGEVFKPIYVQGLTEGATFNVIVEMTIMDNCSEIVSIRSASATGIASSE